MEELISLKDLKENETGIIKEVGGEGALRQHFLDMGVIPGTEVTVIKFAPMGDPVELRVRGYELTLRLDDASKIAVVKTDPSSSNKEKIINKKVMHPNLGEPGIHHDKSEEHPLPDDHILSFALVGNQNCGKTTLFNCLTGANQHVGNFPGVTVDRKDGPILKHPDTIVTDLPGIYSMSPYSSEEIISRDFVINNKPDAIINIIDVTNIERNLYLTMQLLEMDRPMVIALNMMDELTGNGGSININLMEEMLGVPVVPITAAKNEGVSELVAHALHIAKFQEKPLKQDFCDKNSFGGAVHRCLHGVKHLIEDHAQNADIPVAFASSKVVEGDKLILDRLNLEDNEKEMLEHITLQMEKERNLDRAAAIADMRFSFIEKVCDACLIKPRESKEHIRSGKIDKLLTGKYTAIPTFILIMAGVFYLTFNVIGAFFQEILEVLIENLGVLVDSLLKGLGVNSAIHSLVIDGIFEGIGSVLSFLPIVVTMFFFLSMLEDSGYIARVAFFMDKLLRKIGLSGRSIVPMLIGFGCTVPAVMATRTLPSDRDRKMTIVLTPFMSCTAKLPIYAFFVNTFFKEIGGLVMTGLYLLGILIGILVAFINKQFIFKGEAVPFVMELPNYRMPTLKSTLQLMWEKAKDFLQKAFSVILIATIVVWFLQSFTFTLSYTEDSSVSVMAHIAGVVAPVLKPLGLNDWRIVTALISGFMAKESVVSTLEVLFASFGGVLEVISPISAACLLVFSLLYAPCVAAIASIKRELGAGYAIGVVLWQTAIAYVAAIIVKVVLTIL